MSEILPTIWGFRSLSGVLDYKEQVKQLKLQPTKYFRPWRFFYEDVRQLSSKIFQKQREDLSKRGLAPKK